MTNAMGYIKQAIDLEPVHGYSWFEMGNCQRALALSTAARISYQRCLELGPDFREARSAIDELSGDRRILARLGGVWRRWSGR